MKKVFTVIILIIVLGYLCNNTESISKTFNNVNLFQKEDKLILVNKDNKLTKEYKPRKLDIPDIEFTDEASEEEKHVSKVITKPLERLIEDAKEEGIFLLGNSGYRSYSSQENVYESRIELEGKEIADAYVAKPGFSEHQTGLCIDLTNRDRYFVKGTEEAEWLAENCYKYGFIIRYPEGKEEVTGIAYEPWHIRYVGEDSATYIHNNGITLEEYLMRED